VVILLEEWGGDNISWVIDLRALLVACSTSAVAKSGIYSANVLLRGNLVQKGGYFENVYKILTSQCVDVGNVVSQMIDRMPPKKVFGLFEKPEKETPEKVETDVFDKLKKDLKDGKAN